MSKTLEQRLTEDRRLVLLRCLADLPGMRSNSSVLHGHLDHWGHSVSRDYVKTQLRWLGEQELVTLVDAGGVLVATLTERGHDVVAGTARVDGVARPLPKA